MSNIHGFGDIDSGAPNNNPAPNPWGSQGGNRYSRLEDQNYNQQQQMPGMGANQAMMLRHPDGTSVPMNSMNPGRMCLLCCCPCCVPPCCSEARKKWYQKQAKSFCFLISVVQIIMFIISLGMGGVVPMKENPSIGPGCATLDKLGAKDGTKMRYQYEVWRFITPIFLHGGFIHIFFNLYVQFMIAMNMEFKWGWQKFIPIYFLAGIGGNVMSCLIQPNAAGVGASGSLLGVLGAYLIDIIMTWRQQHPMVRRSALFQIIFFIGLSLIMGLPGTSTSFVDGSAHLGGVVVGMILGCIFFTYQTHSEKVKKVLPKVAIALLLIYFILGFSLFYTIIKVVEPPQNACFHS